MSYVDGFVTAVPTAKKDAYREHASIAWEVFKELGATRQVECWGDDVPDGKLTDFRRAVQATADETVVFSWLEYPSRAVRDEVMRKMMDDPRIKSMSDSMPFDGKRMIYGGFTTLVDERA